MNKKQMMEGIKSWDKEEQVKFIKVFNELYSTKTEPSEKGKEIIKQKVKEARQCYNRIVSGKGICVYCGGNGFVSNGKSKRRCVCNSL